MCQNLIGIFLVSRPTTRYILCIFKQISCLLKNVRIRKMGHILFWYIPDISPLQPLIKKLSNAVFINFLPYLKVDGACKDSFLIISLW